MGLWLSGRASAWCAEGPELDALQQLQLKRQAAGGIKGLDSQGQSEQTILPVMDPGLIPPGSFLCPSTVDQAWSLWPTSSFSQQPTAGFCTWQRPAPSLATSISTQGPPENSLAEHGGSIYPSELAAAKSAENRSVLHKCIVPSFRSSSTLETSKTLGQTLRRVQICQVLLDTPLADPVQTATP